MASHEVLAYHLNTYMNSFFTFIYFNIPRSQHDIAVISSEMSSPGHPSFGKVVLYEFAPQNIDRTRDAVLTIRGQPIK